MTPQKMQELNKAIELYGRKIISVGGQEVVYSNIIGDYRGAMFVIDFKPMEKGCLTYILGHAQPMRFVFQTDKMETITQVKRLIPTLLKTVRNSPIISVIYLKKNINHFVDFIHHAMRDVFTDEKFYSQPVREFHRALSGKGIDKIRDIACAVIEYDTAYRYRFQDTMCEIDKKAFESHPIKELKRIIGIYAERDGYGGNGMIQKIGKAMPFVLLSAFIFRNKLKEIVRDINLDEIKPSVEDAYWMKTTGVHKYAIH